MSFILDAIKKSERERQRARQPDVFSLQDAGVADNSSKTQGSRLILLLVALPICVAIGWWLWPGIVEQFGRSSAEQPGQPAVNRAADNAIVNASAAPPVTAQTDASSIKSRAVSPAAQQLDYPEYSSAGVYPSSGDGSELPPRHLIKELWELPADFQSTVPDMEFSFHVFSKNPEKRTIIINGRRLREGQMVASQLKLHVITSTGVILFYRDRYFHVDIVDKW